MMFTLVPKYVRNGNIGIIKEMMRNGIMSTVEMSKILEREFDVKNCPVPHSGVFFRTHIEDV